MKRGLLLAFCLWWTCACFSQERDSLLSRINMIKMDTEKYLYGLCTLSDNSDPDASRQVARKDLFDQLNIFLTPPAFRYLSPDNIPEETVSYIICPLYPDCFRTIAYIPIPQLAEMESNFEKQMQDNGRTEAVNHFLTVLPEARTIGDIERLLADDVLDRVISAGKQVDEKAQNLLERSYLVYYNPKTGAVLEIMTPPTPGEGRKNLRTHAPADPLYYKTTPIWICLNGFDHL